MFSFKFNNVDIQTLATTGIIKIGIIDISRPARPEYVTRKLEIPGRNGSWDFGQGAKKDFEISVTIRVIADNMTNATAAVKALDTFFTGGKKALVFSDDTTKTYQAQVNTIVPVTRSRELGGNIADAQITFNCDA